MSNTTPKIFVKFWEHLFKGEMGDMSSAGAVYKIALVKDTWTPAQATHEAYDDFSAYECTGTAYVAGGATVGSKTCGTSGLVFTFDSDDVSWTNSTIPDARYAVLYYDSPATAATKYAVGYWDLLQNHGSSSTTFLLVMPSDGIITEDVT